MEIGCLSPYNAISTSSIFDDVVRIDLNSQNSLILEQNFMDRPLPQKESEKFNLISCSLVINFVPSPKEREMLLRITKFLKKPKHAMSALFWYCRYLVFLIPDILITKLIEIMTALGFTQTFSYEGNKVVYWLFDWNGKVNLKKNSKKELHSGSIEITFALR